MRFDKYEWLKKRWSAYWALENHDRPIIAVYAPNGKTPKTQVKEPNSVLEKWLDPDFVIPNFRRGMECTHFAGEAFPMYWANLGPDVIGALAGCKLEYTMDTSWAQHFVTDWESLPEICFDQDNFYYKKLIELTQAAIADCNGDYLIGNTDIHAGPDGLVALRSPENLCYDVADCPELLNERIDQLFEIEKEVYNRLNQLIAASGQEGTTNWMGIWHPEKNWYPTSCDFSCMISSGDFEELVIPGLKKELAFFDASIYHLDGVDALRHLDRLIAIPELDGIQWVPGAGKPSVGNWIPELKKIQDAGKRIMVGADCPEDIRLICENLRPEGVMIGYYAPNVEVADRCISMAEDICKKWRPIQK